MTASLLQLAALKVGELMIASPHQVPLLQHDWTTWPQRLEEIANFLRSGCPAIQLTSSYHFVTEEVNQAVRKVQEALNEISFNGEKFLCDLSLFEEKDLMILTVVLEERAHLKGEPNRPSMMGVVDWRQWASATNLERVATQLRSAPDSTVQLVWESYAMQEEGRQIQNEAVLLQKRLNKIALTGESFYCELSNIDERNSYGFLLLTVKLCD